MREGFPRRGVAPIRDVRAVLDVWAMQAWRFYHMRNKCNAGRNRASGRSVRVTSALHKLEYPRHARRTHV